MASKLSILITTDYYHPVKNGVATYIDTLCSFFPDAHITVLTYRLPRTQRKELADNKTIIRLDAQNILGAGYAPPLTLPALPAHDIVITNTRFFTSALTGARLAKQWNVPHIHVEHGNRHVPHPNIFFRTCAWLYDQTFGRYVLYNADTVVCIAKAGIPFTRNLGAHGPKYIPNAINPLDYTPSATLRVQTRKKYHLDGQVLVYVGRLVEEKGLLELLEAAAGTDYTILFVGEGPLRPTLMERAQDLHVQVRFAGKQDKEGVHAALCAADLFVNPSWAEGLPTSVLEALAAKVPVLATDVGGTGEILAQTNLVPARDVAALHRALRRKVKQLPFPAEYSVQSVKKQWQALVKAQTS